MKKSSKTSVGCGHASCGVGKGCAVGKGQDSPAEEKSEVKHERKEMKLVKAAGKDLSQLKKMHPPSMLGSGQAPGQPVIPGIRQQRGAPPPVNFGQPEMGPYTTGVPRSTRQGPHNMQGQGPPQGRGGKKPRVPKSGPVVHPGKRGK